MVGRSGDIYHYEFFDPRANQFSRLSMFHLDEATWRLDALMYAQARRWCTRAGADGQPERMWIARSGWTREFTTANGSGGGRSAAGHVRRRSRSGRFRSSRPRISRPTIPKPIG